MKTNLIILSLLLTVNLLCAQTRIIERPNFDIRNTRTLEFDKIELSDTATILYISAYSRPKSWIVISKTIYIQESGTTNKLVLKGAEGIEPDSAFRFTESGQVSFKLIFPPLPKNVTKIDLIEGADEKFYKIWGIHLDPNEKPMTATIPEDILKSQNSVAKPLPKAEIKPGKALLSGQLVGYRPGFGVDYMLLSVFDPISTDRKEVRIKLNDDGSFKQEVPILCPQIIIIEYITSYDRIYLAPDEKTEFYVDLYKKSHQESRYQKNPEDESPFVYTKNSLNLSTSDMEEMDAALWRIDRRKIVTDIYNMEPEAYKNYIMEHLNKALAEVKASEKLNATAKHKVELDLKISFLNNFLLSYTEMAKRSYLMKHKLGPDAIDTISYKPAEPNKSYYISFLKDFNLNDNDYLYTVYSPTVKYLTEIKELNADTTGLSISEWLKKEKVLWKNILPENSGIFYDLMAALRYSSQLQNMKPFTEKEKQDITALFANKTYSTELLSENKKIEQLIADNKKQTEVIIHTLSKDIPLDQSLNSIIAQFKGKVVFVDFWATWCGPCRYAMKLADPVKEFFKGKEVVFLYLTGETSPMKPWMEMIPGIHGDHYRVTDEIWKHWMNQYKIEGIPTYMIFNKEGKQTHFVTSFMGVDKMKEWIDESL